jgi:hypothetical protein
MAYMKEDSKVMIVLKTIWPPINKVLNMVFYFLVSMIKGFFREAMSMIKGGGG